MGFSQRLRNDANLCFTTPVTSAGDLVQEIKLPGHPFDDGAIFRSDSEDFYGKKTKHPGGEG